PSFETTACGFVTPIQVRVTCGFVHVPEDRNGDLTDTIQLAVAIYHSTGDAPKPDPILYLQGGPGAKAIEWSAGAYESVIAPYLEERDFIVFDQRGVGYSKPVLDCEEIKSTYLQDVQGDLPADQKVSYYEGALLTCKNNFNNLGINPSAYTSVDIAADAKDVIVALGYDQANLYGISYGTRIAQFVMRNHPEVVRSAILDSVVPVETQLLKPDTNTEQDRLIHLLFEECNANLACSSAFPNLESVYNEAINKLDAEPVKITLTINNEKTLEQTINGSSFRSTIIWGLRSPQTIAAIPHFIYRTRDGDHSQLLYAAALPLITFDSISIGTYVAVHCHDQIFAIPTEGLDETIYDLCRLWGIEPPLPGENDPVHSDIPTLILAGKYDSVTPTTFAHQLAGHLTHSTLVEFPNQGHAPSASEISDCPKKIIAAFLQDPNTSPDIGCVNETSTINFVIPFNPNAPVVLEPVAVEEYQVSTLIPAGWTRASFGFYNRSGSMADITQVGIQRAAVSESEWVAWLSTNFRSNQGFDQPAVKKDERQANGLTWTIYQTSSQGNPVDIAFAKYGNETLMVLLFSHKDERDALYNTVFIPIVDSTKSSN
ncbi:MAG: alpha/beta hydrolase, partial [Anaerolineae bacterium]|nr:alpha/beta hydrolase [Anaerolineae bacterium]